jgi:hypothetical protein
MDIGIMIKIVTNIETETLVDLNHYREAWKIGTKMINYQSLPGLNKTKGTIVSPHDIDLPSIITYNKKFRNYYNNQEKNTVAFVGDMNTFYSNSFIVTMKILTVFKWIQNLDNLNTCPLKENLNNDKTYDILWTWLFKHNIRFLRV